MFSAGRGLTKRNEWMEGFGLLDVGGSDMTRKDEDERRERER